MRCKLPDSLVHLQGKPPLPLYIYKENRPLPLYIYKENRQVERESRAEGESERQTRAHAEDDTTYPKMIQLLELS